MNTNVLDQQVVTLLDELQIQPETRDLVRVKINLILRGKEEDLKRIFGNDIALTHGRAKYIPRFADEPMIYRDYVGIHSQRVQAFMMGALSCVQFAIPDLRENQRIAYLSQLCLYHDIIEGISPFGDIPTPIKLSLSHDSVVLMDTIEERLGRILFEVRPHPTLPEFDQQMLQDIIGKKSIESKIVSYIDKLDGFMTSIHELIAGNKSFMTPFNNYIKIFRDIKAGKKLPEIQDICDSLADYKVYIQAQGHIYEPHILQRLVESVCIFDIDSILEQAERVEEFFGKCDTTELMREHIDDDFGFPAYGFWKHSVNMVLFQTGPGYWDRDDILIKRHREPDIPELYRTRAA